MHKYIHINGRAWRARPRSGGLQETVMYIDIIIIYYQYIIIVIYNHYGIESASPMGDHWTVIFIIRYNMIIPA